MRALIIVDVQNDFVTGGKLEVSNGEQIIPIVNQLAEKFELVIATQDWHPADHKSFASQHEGKQPFDKTTLRSEERRVGKECNTRRKKYQKKKKNSMMTCIGRIV